GAQSAFSLSSSGSKPAPSGPKNPTPKPGDSTESKRQAIEKFFADTFKAAGVERSAAYDKIARDHIKLAQEGKLELTEESYDGVNGAGATVLVDGLIVVVVRYENSTLNNLDKALNKPTEVEPVPAATKAGVATDADDKYTYLGLVIQSSYNEPAE
ncbi:hypothetical protein, partial [Corynebacterium casei]|uniref:hypothetical protein n=1 Tax=Corynebacterium casei TaxID=160386 RepID=UPI003F910844